jgi:hypothetical protein
MQLRRRRLRVALGKETKAGSTGDCSDTILLDLAWCFTKAGQTSMLQAATVIVLKKGMSSKLAAVGMSKILASLPPPDAEARHGARPELGAADRWGTCVPSVTFRREPNPHLPLSLVHIWWTTTRGSRTSSVGDDLASERPVIDAKPAKSWIRTCGWSANRLHVVAYPDVENRRILLVTFPRHGKGPCAGERV